jgi:pyridoxal phosphate enzyme (YggS family)
MDSAANDEGIASTMPLGWVPVTIDMTGLTIADRLAHATMRLEKAANAAGRDPGEISILLATKTQPISVVRAAIEAGGTLVGENRVQEMVAKAPGLTDLPHRMHMIGSLQRNKARHAVAVADAIDTVADIGLAKRLNTLVEQGVRPPAKGPLPVMVQVNTSGETSKSGCQPNRAEELAAEVASLRGLRLVGLMTIGLSSCDGGAVAQSFARLRDLRDAIVGSGNAGTSTAVQLSMGMSTDMDLAIAEGATIVRLGSAVFGPRPAG